MIAALAIVGRDNSPIFVKTFNQTTQLDDIKFHFIVHTSLDSFDEKRTWASLSIPLTSPQSRNADLKTTVAPQAPSSAPSSTPAPSTPHTPNKAKKERYLGLLFPTESYRVYGYASVSLTKLILVLNDLSNAKDQEIRNFFTKFHALYTDAVCNPFYNVGDTITSKTFEKKIGTLASTGL